MSSAHSIGSLEGRDLIREGEEEGGGASGLFFLGSKEWGGPFRL